MKEKGLTIKKAEGKVPEELPESLKLNLGCGKDFREGYLNIDLYSDDPRVIFMDVRKLDFEDSSVDEIVAFDILEHFSHRETGAVLAEWARVLKPGGILRLRVPSLELQIAAYRRGDWDADTASIMIFGGQSNPGDFHAAGFDEQSIKKHLRKAGFRVTSIEDFDFPQKDSYINLNMEVRARKTIPFRDEKPAVEDMSDIGDFDFDTENEEMKTSHELDDFSEDELNFDMDILEDFVKDDIARQEETPAGPKLNIVWEGAQFANHSFAKINREHCMNLEQSGEVNLNIVPFGDSDFSPIDHPRYEKIEKNLVQNKKPVSDEVGNLPYVWVRHQWPVKGEVPKGARWIVMQPWEYDVLLKEMKDTFDLADEIWTPSNFSRHSFINSGIPAEKIHVIPNGIDPEIFKPAGEKYSLETEKSFKLLFLGGTIHRKGIDILLNAYKRAFTPDDDICLVIKDVGNDDYYKAKNASKMIEEFKADEKNPEILYLDKVMPEEDIAALYRSCDLFVSPYRGEGFSLPTLEAMACGLPPLVTRGGATDDFVKEGFGFFIKSEKENIGREIDGREFISETSVLKPDEGALSATLSFLYKNPGILKSMGITASYSARSKYNFKTATLKVLSRLDILYGTNMASNAVVKLTEPDDAWIKFGRAEMLYSEGDYFKARKEFHAALETEDLSDALAAHAYNRLAITAIDKGEFDEAKEFLSYSESRKADSPDLLYCTAVYYCALKDFDSALQYVTVAIQRWNVHKYDSSFGINLDDILVLGGDIMRAAIDLDGAVDMYKQALKVNHENFFACYGAGMCFITADETEMAKEMLDWALRYNPNFKPALEALEKVGAQ